MTTSPKTDTGERDGLLHRLRRAPSRELLELVEQFGRDFAMRELRQVLLNSFCDGEVLKALAANRKLMSTRQAQAAVARHRRTPEPVAMRLIPNLFWRDLTEITLDTRIRGAVRRSAERYLTQRLPRLTEGEKIHLARRSIDTVAALLIAQTKPRVVDAGLENPRLTEKALLTVVTSERTPPRLLARIAEHERWGNRYEVRAALCGNARTPYGIVLRHLETLKVPELERVLANDEHAGFVQALAEELIEARMRPTSRSAKAGGGSRRIGLESPLREKFSLTGDEENP